jgi:hypothetical protein
VALFGPEAGARHHQRTEGSGAVCVGGWGYLAALVQLYEEPEKPANAIE